MCSSKVAYGGKEKGSGRRQAEPAALQCAGPGRRLWKVRGKMRRGAAAARRQRWEMRQAGHVG